MENFSSKIIKYHIHFYLPFIFGWGVFHFICLTLGQISESTIPKAFNFYIPVLFSLLALYLTHILKDKEKVIQRSLNLLFIFNFLWLIHLGHSHDSSLTGHVVILGFVLVNLSMVGRYDFIKSVLIGLIQLFIFFLSYSLYNASLGKDDLYAYHYILLITFLIGLFNQLLSDRSKSLKALQRDIENKNIEMKDILDNLTTSHFAIGKDFKVEAPVSKFSENVFEKDIMGLNIFDLLYFNMDRETKEFKDLYATYSIIFGADQVQFMALKDNLPLKVPFINEKNNTKKILKISYKTLLDHQQRVEQIRCIAEDITESEVILHEAQHDQTNFSYVKEIVSIRNKEKIALNLENSLQSGYNLLYQFVSDHSKNKDYPYFRNNLKECLNAVQKNTKDLKLLNSKLNQSVWRIIAWEDNPHHEMNPNIEASSIMGDILGHLIQYSKNARLIFPIDISISDHLSKIILEKLQENRRLINDLFEKVLFIKDILKIEENQYENISKFAKMHHSFDKLIIHIQQDSVLITSLLKAIGEDQLSKCYEDFTFIIKKLPEKKNLNQSTIKNYLILPYKIFLDKTKDIKNRFTI